MTREIDRRRWALETAQRGKTVALVCSGDAGFYGMASPLLELAAQYPGGTGRDCARPDGGAKRAAVLGAPLAHDFLCDFVSPTG